MSRAADSLTPQPAAAVYRETEKFKKHYYPVMTTKHDKMMVSAAFSFKAEKKLNRHFTYHVLIIPQLH